MRQSSGRSLDKRNFRGKILSTGLLIASKEMEITGRKPARLYRIPKSEMNLAVLTMQKHVDLFGEERWLRARSLIAEVANR